MSEPMTPAQVEASGVDTIEVEYLGDRYTMPATADDWDIEALELFQSGRSVAAVGLLMGTKQYSAFKVKHRTARRINEFADQLAVLYGFKSAGE